MWHGIYIKYSKPKKSPVEVEPVEPFLSGLLYFRIHLLLIFLSMKKVHEAEANWIYVYGTLG